MNRFLMGICVIFMLLWLTHASGSQEQPPPTTETVEDTPIEFPPTLAEYLKLEVEKGQITAEMAFELLAANSAATLARTDDWRFMRNNNMYTTSIPGLAVVPGMLPPAFDGRDLVGAMSSTQQTVQALVNKINLLEKKINLLQKKLDVCCRAILEGGQP